MSDLYKTIQKITLLAVILVIIDIIIGMVASLRTVHAELSFDRQLRRISIIFINSGWRLGTYRCGTGRIS